MTTNRQKTFRLGFFLFSVFVLPCCMSASVTPTGSTASPSTVTIALNPSSITVMTGEPINFVASGGASPYTFLGYNYPGNMVTATGVYMIPLNSTFTSEKVVVYDNNGKSASAPVYLTGFAALSNIPGFNANAMKVAWDGTLYVVGQLTQNPNFFWAVYKSTDEGATWNNVDKIFSNTGVVPEASDIAFDNVNHYIYVTGQIDATHLGIRKSIDSGATWTNIDTVVPAGYPNAPGANKIAVNSSGQIVWFPSSNTGGCGTQPTFDIRTSPVGGTAFTTQTTIYSNGYPSNLFFHSPYFYRVYDTNIDRSTDGITWTNIFNSAKSPTNFTIQSLVTDSKGTFWANGYTPASSSVVAKSTDGGSTWTATFTANTWHFYSPFNTTSSTLLINSLGNMYVFNQPNLYKSKDGGVTWYQVANAMTSGNISYQGGVAALPDDKFLIGLQAGGWQLQSLKTNY